MKSLSRRHSTARLVARVLEDPSLPERIRSLPPERLHELVRAVGLEDSGELVALATPDQLVSLFDGDLWTSARPGEEEAFDAPRFVTWLEVLAEAGIDRAAARLAQCSEEFLALALSRLVLVVESEVVQREVESDDERIEKLLESQLVEELGEYFLVSKLHEGWDTLLGVLLAWDRDDHGLCERLLARLSRSSARHIDESGGLSEVLTELETLEEDAAAEREERRARVGYVEPRSALAFLRLARRTPPTAPEEDAISRAYFRALAPERPGRRASRAQSVERKAPEPSSVEAPFLALLASAADEERARPVLRSASASEGSLFRRALRGLSLRDPVRHARLLDELAFLTNVLVSGADRSGERWTPETALEEVVRVVESVLPNSEAPAIEELDRWGLIGLFRRGYAGNEGASSAGS